MAMAFARMARQRHVVGPALLAASTIAFVPRATVCRGTPDRFRAAAGRLRRRRRRALAKRER